MNRRRLRPLTFAVVVVLLALTATLAWAAHTVNAHSNQRLLEQEVQQAAATLSASVPIIETRLTLALDVAERTNAAVFRTFAAPLVGKNSVVAVSLWRVSDGSATQLAATGTSLSLDASGKVQSALGSLRPSPTMYVTQVLPGPRIGYAVMSKNDTSGLVVYAEAQLPEDRRIKVQPGSPFDNLDFALYLGPDATADALIAATGNAPITGKQTATATLPFGDKQITIVGSSRSHLAGDLSAALPWIALGVGLALTVLMGGTVEYMGRRRGLAEALAADNARLYREQHGIASTLQHALLPDVPHDPSIDVAARYVAGVAGVEVGGDWYDVMRTGPHSLTFFVGDVSGRGLHAATTMASLRYAARAYVADGDDIATVLAKLGRLIDVETDQQFATVLAGEIDLGSYRLRIASAGHFLPLIATKEGVGFLSCEVQPPIGVAPQQRVTTLEIDLPPGGTLLAFTDGLVERRGESIDVGQQRLRDTADGLDVPLTEVPLPDLLDALLAALVPDGAKDDVAMLAIRWA